MIRMINLPTDILCGYYDCSGFSGLSVSPKRKVQKYELELFLKDGRSTFCDNKEYKVKKGYILIAKPDQIRNSLLPFTTFYLKFNITGDIAEKLINAPHYFKAVHFNKIKALYKEIILREEKDLLFYSKILELINIILKDSEIPTFEGNTTYKTISVAKRYIEENSCDSLNLSDIACAVNLSQTYFHTLFTASVGCSPHDYLIKCRIENAKKMLWNSENELKDIAVMCGFGCQQYMNKVFKSQTGLTPGQYRKFVQNNYLL